MPSTEHPIVPYDRATTKPPSIKLNQNIPGKLPRDSLGAPVHPPVRVVSLSAKSFRTNGFSDALRHGMIVLSCGQALEFIWSEYRVSLIAAHLTGGVCQVASPVLRATFRSSYKTLEILPYRPLPWGTRGTGESHIILAEIFSFDGFKSVALRGSGR